MTFTGDGDENEDVGQIFKIGEETYNEEQLTKILEKQKLVEQLEKDHGDISNVSKVLGTRASKIGELNRQIEALKKGDLDTEESPEDGEETARTTDQSSAKDGDDDVSFDDGIKMIKEKGQFMTSQEATDQIRHHVIAQRLTDQVEALTEEIDGSDGRPKFVAMDILAYMRENNLNNPEKAYRLKHEDTLLEWKERTLRDGVPNGLHTETNTSSRKEPVSKTPRNEKDLKAAIKEFLNVRESGR